MYENNREAETILKNSLRMKPYAFKFDCFYFTNVSIMADR